MNNWYQVGADAPPKTDTKAGMASIAATLLLGGLVVYGFTRRPRRSAGPDMRDVEARIRSRGIDPRGYGW